ncbi:MAG: ABC transporter permease [Pseudomonadota bacterium]
MLPSANYRAKAVRDLRDGLKMWPIWRQIANNEIRDRYRRSTLGPLWASITMGVQATVTAFVLGFLFGNDLERFMPFITISLILWNFIMGTVNEGAMSFISAADRILEIKRPFSYYIYLVIWRNILLVGHSMVVFAIAILIFGLYPGWTYIMVIPGFLLLVLNLSWMSLMAAIFAVRFRDVPLIVSNSFTLLFWLTPILYDPDQLHSLIKTIVRLNPLTHLFEIVRAPLLLETPLLENWLVAIVMVILGWTATFILFARTRHRIAFWV